MSRRPTASQPRRKAVSKKNLLWAIPLALIVTAGLAVLALPSFVASGYHRGTIEALASKLTGRTVHINGGLSLALLPHPEFIAGDITITSPDHETIIARSLTLDIAPVALLHGQISARSIMLESPRIALPWPLPGGANAIAPPNWLTTLHAQISNGEISLGGVEFTQVSADIFTAGQGTFSVAGSGMLAGAPVTVALSFGAVSAVGSTPVTLDIQTNDAAALRAHVTGNFDGASAFSGHASFGAASLSGLDPALSQPLSGNAAISADPVQILLSNLAARQGSSSLAGSATFSLQPPALSLVLTGNHLIMPPSLRNDVTGFAGLPVHLTLDATDTTIAARRKFTIAQLQTSLDLDGGALSIRNLTASQSGADLSLSGELDPAGGLQANAIFNSDDLGSLFQGNFPAGWDSASLRFGLGGTVDDLTLGDLSGHFGPAMVSGNAVLAHRDTLSGQLHFDQLALAPFIAALRDTPSGLGVPQFSGDLEITADRASLGPIALTHLLGDASIGRQLIVHRLSAAVYGGIAAASFTLSGAPGSTAQVTSARAILALPSAAPLAALLPVALRPPAVLTKAPLALSFAAAGPTTALATRANLTLGAIQITAAPVFDIAQQTATGAFTLRHPSAINAFKAFGIDAGLAWPGAGSIALRANVLVSPPQIGLTDFVLSMGDLTSNGQLVYGTDHRLNGVIDADTLALPPIPAKFTPPWAYLADMQGKISISANSVLVAGSQILGPSAAVVMLSPGKFDLQLNQAMLANGKFNGDLSASLPAAPAAASAPVLPPMLSAKLVLTNADASGFNLPIAFPFTVTSGKINAATNFTATGYASTAWLSTLSGTASLAANAGTLNGFNLPGLQSALTAIKNRSSQLRSASLDGSTPFTRLNVTSNLTSGVATLTSATVQSTAGSATATGDIDLPDNGVTLQVNLTPTVPAPPKVTVTIAGNWAAPRKIASMNSAINWKPPEVEKTHHHPSP